MMLEIKVISPVETFPVTASSLCVAGDELVFGGLISCAYPLSYGLAVSGYFASGKMLPFSQCS